jgi:hypothetical protein
MSRKRKLVLSEILAALDFSDQDSDGLPEIEIEKPEESEEDEEEEEEIYFDDPVPVPPEVIFYACSFG